MFPDISSFLKDTLNTSFTKLLQPDKIVVASIFMLLNLLTFTFLSPNFFGQSSFFFTAFLTLNPILQTILALVIVLVLSYLLLSLNTFILSLMTGDLWKDSLLLGRLFTNLQKIQFHDLQEQENTYREQVANLQTQLEQVYQNNNSNNKNLTKKIQHLENQKKEANVRKLEVAWQRAVSFPLEEEQITATSLGNTLNATASYIWKHYGIDMTALWPHMEIIIDDLDQKALATRIDNEKSTLDFLISLAFVLILFALEQILLQFFWLRQGLAVLSILPILILAFIIYRAAISKARTWGAAVQMAFDQHRDELRQKLCLQPFTSQENEHETWEEVSKWLLWNTPTISIPDNVFRTPQAIAPPSATSSGNVKTVINCSKKSWLTSPSGLPTTPSSIIKRFYEYIDYTLLVSNIEIDSSKSPLKDIYIIAFDPQIATIDGSKVAAKDWYNIPYEAKVIPTNDTNAQNQLLWHIETLQSNSSLALSYQLPCPDILLKATPVPSYLKLTLREDPELGAVKYTFSIHNDGNNTKAILEVLDNSRPLHANEQIPNGILLGPGGQLKVIIPEKLLKPDGYKWKLGTLLPDETITLIYIVRNNEGAHT